MRYILDFDDTLFDTARFVSQVEADGRGDVLKTEAIWEHYEAKDFFYDDVMAFLKRKPREDLVVLTSFKSDGNEEARRYHKAKVERSNIHSYVSDVIFSEGSKAPYVEKISKGTPALFIDDTPEHLMAVKECCPHVRCFQMQRANSRHKYTACDHPGIQAIHTLNGL